MNDAFTAKDASNVAAAAQLAPLQNLAQAQALSESLRRYMAHCATLFPEAMTRVPVPPPAAPLPPPPALEDPTRTPHKGEGTVRGPSHKPVTTTKPAAKKATFVKA